MKKRVVVLTVLFAVVFMFLFVSLSRAQSDETVMCPVSGEKIKKSEAKDTYVYKGKTYYFCCDNCKTSFLKDPEKYTSGEATGEHMQAHHENGEVIDPVCGMKIEKSEAKATFEYKGKTYYFCMEGCKEKFMQEPEKYIKDSDLSLVCPVSGETFNKSEDSESYEYKGKVYYFCCPGCKDKFVKDPEKYIKN